MNDAGFRVRLADGREFGPASAEMLAQWAREGRIPRDASVVLDDDSLMPAIQHPAIAPVFGAPPVVRPIMAAGRPDAPMSGLIPYRNAPALVGYYVSVASLIPFVGMLLGPVAIVLGVVGFRAYRREPHRKGAAHSWVAIILGSITTVGYWGILLLLIIGPRWGLPFMQGGSPGRAAAPARPAISAPSPAPNAGSSTAPAPR
jgi:hypothetical protein